MANFMQAVKWMKEGKKVRRKSWCDEGGFLEQKQLYIIDEEGDRESNIWDTIQFEAKDWEIYEEKDNWNLADNVSDITKFGGRVHLYSDDEIKTFIREVKKDIDVKLDNSAMKDWIFEQIDKRAGKL